MARRRRLMPAQPGYLTDDPAPETKTLPAASAAKAAPIAQVSGQSAEAAALRELAEGIRTARTEGRMIVDVPLADVAPEYLLRDRIGLDEEELEALKASIRRHGQRTPAEIAPLPETPDDGALPYSFGLISGWRRLRALSELYDETGESRFSTIRALLRSNEDAADSYVAMIEENEIRVGLSYYERARVVAESVRRGVFADHHAALRTLFATASRAKRSKIGSFIDIHEALGDVLTYPAAIPERLGLALVSRLRFGARVEMRKALNDAGPGSAEAEIALLEKLSQAPRPPVSRAKQPSEVLRNGAVMTAQRQSNKITLTLKGDAVDDALLEAVRKALHDLT